MEEEGQEVAAAPGGVSRGQNTVYVLPHDWASIALFLGPIIQRVDESSPDLQLVVITSDAELAAAVAMAAVKLANERGLGIVAVTSARRAARLIRLRPPQVLAGTADALVDLVRGAAIKVETVRLACLAWADEIIVNGALPSLETLMGELPKDSSRTVVTAELTPAVEELLERYARRARRVVAPASEGELPVNVDYVSVSSHTRLQTLRRVLDELDPPSAMVFVREGEDAVPVRNLVRALGYAGSDAAVTVGLAAPPGTDLVVLYDLPASRQEMRDAAGAAKRAVALVQPRQLASLRALSAGGTVGPVTLPEAGLRARDRDTRIRAELRELLGTGQFGRELLALEPLLDEYDGIEIAAAALQRLEQERAAHATAAAAKSAAPVPSAPRDRDGAGMVRLFINVGSRDNVRPGDLVGAITNQAGIAGTDVGKVDVRESHSIVEVSPAVADVVIERVTGTDIRGRRAVARRDEERPKRESGERRAPSRGQGSGRPQRDGPGGGSRGSGRDTRGGERDARGPRRPSPAQGARDGPREPGRDRE